MTTKPKTTATPLETAELLVQTTGEAFNNAKSALKILKQSLKPAKAAKEPRGPSARGVLIAALIVNPSTDITELVASLGCLAGTVNESRMVAKAVLDIRDGFAPSINSPRLIGEALKHSGVAALPTKTRPPVVVAEVVKPVKVAKAVKASKSVSAPA